MKSLRFRARRAVQLARIANASLLEPSPGCYVKATQFTAASKRLCVRAPRQVGKTTLAKEIAKQHKRDAVYLDLESTVDRRRLTDAEAFLSAQRGKLVVIDEIHRAPDLFDTLRGVIDERRSTGAHTAQFLLLGSAGIDLMRQSSESLAGRVAYIELPAIDVLEFAKRDSDVDRLWVRGGFPESLLARNDALSLA